MKDNYKELNNRYKTYSYDKNKILEAERAERRESLRQFTIKILSIFLYAIVMTLGYGGVLESYSNPGGFSLYCSIFVSMVGSYLFIKEFEVK